MLRQLRQAACRWQQAGSNVTQRRQFNRLFADQVELQPTPPAGPGGAGPAVHEAQQQPQQQRNVW